MKAAINGNIYKRNARAYCHSFAPSSTGRYILSMVTAGSTLADAINQASIEHGWDQAQEIADLTKQELHGRSMNDRRSLIPAIRRAIHSASVYELTLMSVSSVTAGPPDVMHFSCDNGHRWTSTEAEDAARQHRCPYCGDYWQ
jgi:hypothetical protein